MSDKPRTFKDLTMSEGVKLIDEIFDAAPVEVEGIGTPSRDEPHRSEKEKLEAAGFGGGYWRLIKDDTV